MLNHEGMKKFGEKENHKYLEMLKVDIIEEAEMKEK